MERERAARLQLAEVAEADAAELEQLRADAVRQSEEFRNALESRARILRESRDELRGRAERAERELDGLRQGTGDGQPAPTLLARRRRARQMYVGTCPAAPGH